MTRSMRSAERSSGLSLLEVILALAVLAVLGATFTTAILSNLRRTTTAGQRTQSSQVLNYLGRRVAGGDAAVLPTLGESLTWDYGQLGIAFPDLQSGEGFAEPERYQAQVVASGTVSVAGSNLVQYDLQVCFQGLEGESCVSGTTLGAPIEAAPEDTPPLPGIN